MIGDDETTRAHPPRGAHRITSALGVWIVGDHRDLDVDDQHHLTRGRYGSQSRRHAFGTKEPPRRRRRVPSTPSDGLRGPQPRRDVLCVRPSDEPLLRRGGTSSQFPLPTRPGRHTRRRRLQPLHEGCAHQYVDRL